MAKVIIKIVDKDDGTVDVSAHFEPTVDLKDPDNITMAQLIGLDLIDHVKEVSSKGQLD